MVNEAKQYLIEIVKQHKNAKLYLQDDFFLLQNVFSKDLEKDNKMFSKFLELLGDDSKNYSLDIFEDGDEEEYDELELIYPREDKDLK